MIAAKHTPGPAAEAINRADAAAFEAGIATYTELRDQHAELLEALQATEKVLNNIRVCCHHTAWDATGPAVIAARAIIAKATGSAS